MARTVLRSCPIWTDDELGELYRTKDRTKEHYEFYDGFLDNVAMAFSSPAFLLDLGVPIACSLSRRAIPS